MYTKNPWCISTPLWCSVFRYPGILIAAFGFPGSGSRAVGVVCSAETGVPDNQTFVPLSPTPASSWTTPLFALCSAFSRSRFSFLTPHPSHFHISCILTTRLTQGPLVREGLEVPSPVRCTRGVVVKEGVGLCLNIGFEGLGEVEKGALPTISLGLLWFAFFCLL